MGLESLTAIWWFELQLSKSRYFEKIFKEVKIDNIRDRIPIDLRGVEDEM